MDFTIFFCDQIKRENFPQIYNFFELGVTKIVEILIKLFILAHYEA